MITDSESSLSEREREIGLLRAFIKRIGNSDGGVLVFEGDVGYGKTRLLRILRDDAAGQGALVLRARGNEFEQNFAWSVVKQLFESWLSSMPREDRLNLLVGPAKLAAPLFTSQDGPPEVDDLQQILHGLYWLCRSMSTQRPLVLTVDDAQWADAESLHFLNYLANRLDDGAMGLALASLPVQSTASSPLLAATYSLAPTCVVRLAPLSTEAVNDLVTASLGRKADDEFVRACYSATEGNPLFLRELLAFMATTGVEPIGAKAEEVARSAPPRIAVDVLRWLNRMPPNAVRFARAVAVLGPDSDIRHCAAVAKLSEVDAATAAGALVDETILRPEAPYNFKYPIMQNVVYADLSERERNEAHRRAARSLGATGAPAQAVAEHVAKMQPASDSWAVDILRTAALKARQGDNPHDAVRFLRRALAEPPTDAVRPAVLGELGSAELRVRDPLALVHLAEALHRTPRSALRHSLRLDFGQALTAAGRYGEAMEILEEAMVDSDGLAAGTADQARSYLLVVAEGTARGTTDEVNIPKPRLPVTIGHRAHVAMDALGRGIPADRVARLATSAMDEGIVLGAQDIELEPACIVAWVLARCGRVLDAERVLASVTEQAREAGHVLAEAASSALLALVHYELGQLPLAETEARAVLREQDHRSLAVVSVPVAAAALVHVLIESDRAQEAEVALRQLGFAGRLPDSGFYIPLRAARGRLKTALGRPEDGLRELTECHRFAQERGWDNPGVATLSIADRAHALVRNGNHQAALRLSEEDIARARHFDAPAQTAVALRTHGLVLGGREGMAEIEEAMSLVEESPSDLERVRTTVALGAAQRRLGQRATARRLLLSGMELAQRCGAALLERTARTELRLAGGRVRGAHRPAGAPLTPAEHRVAAMAATGLSNREIAQSLFVTVKTVEWHLNQTYPKLGISRRVELAQALAGAGLSVGEDAEAS